MAWRKNPCTSCSLSEPVQELPMQGVWERGWVDVPGGQWIKVERGGEEEDAVEEEEVALKEQWEEVVGPGWEVVEWERDWDWMREEEEEEERMVKAQELWLEEKQKEREREREEEKRRGKEKMKQEEKKKEAKKQQEAHHKTRMELWWVLEENWRRKEELERMATENAGFGVWWEREGRMWWDGLKGPGWYR